MRNEAGSVTAAITVVTIQFNFQERFSGPAEAKSEMRDGQEDERDLFALALNRVTLLAKREGDIRTDTHMGE